MGSPSRRSTAARRHRVCGQRAAHPEVGVPSSCAGRCVVWAEAGCAERGVTDESQGAARRYASSVRLNPGLVAPRWPSGDLRRLTGCLPRRRAGLRRPHPWGLRSSSRRPDRPAFATSLHQAEIRLPTRPPSHLLGAFQRRRRPRTVPRSPSNVRCPWSAPVCPARWSHAESLLACVGPRGQAAASFPNKKDHRPDRSWWDAPGRLELTMSSPDLTVRPNGEQRAVGGAAVLFGDAAHEHHTQRSRQPFHCSNDGSIKSQGFTPVAGVHLLLLVAGGYSGPVGVAGQQRLAPGDKLSPARGCVTNTAFELVQ